MHKSLLKNLLPFIFSIIFSGSIIHAQITSLTDYKTFHAPQGNYIEIYCSVLSEYIQYLEIDSLNEQAQIEITTIVKSADTIIQFNKVKMDQIVEKTGHHPNFIHLERFALSNGTYSIELVTKDLNSMDEEIIETEKFTCYYHDNHIAISDIELIDFFAPSKEENKLSKAGYDIVPLVTDYYPPSFDKLAYYVEIYNGNQSFSPEEKVYINQYIENDETKKIAGNYSRIKKETPRQTQPILQMFDISALPTGNYQLVIQVKNKQNELICEKKQGFQRLNNSNELSFDHLKDVSTSGTFIDRINKDSLTEFINSLRPLCFDLELRIIDKHLPTMSDTMQEQFFYSFWFNRSPYNQERDWLAYKKNLYITDHLFGTPVKRGYETDRGRIYLKYGPPNKVDDRRSDASAYPYQIWHYYMLGKFRNKRFVFYLPDLITNDYMMLHSDVPGEIQNYHWERDLNIRNMPNSGNIDSRGEETRGRWGNNANTLFKNP